MNAVKKRTVLVTGGSGYIGKQLILSLMDDGYSVLNLDLNDSVDLKVNLKNYSFIKVDFTQVEGLESKILGIVETLECLSGLVCLAAHNQTIKIEGTTQEEIAFSKLPLGEWEKTFTVNVTATMLLNRIAAERMKLQGFGSIVNIASIFALFAPDQRRYGSSGLNSNAAYGASKASVIQLSRFLSSYYQKTGIRINAISPGGIERNQPTDFIENYSSNTALGRMGTPNDVVGAIKFLLSEDSNWITGTNLIVDGGYSIW